MRRVAWIGLAARDGRFNAWIGEGEEKCEIRIFDSGFAPVVMVCLVAAINSLE